MVLGGWIKDGCIDYELIVSKQHILEVKRAVTAER
jgi:hypothetical protein